MVLEKLVADYPELTLYQLTFAGESSNLGNIILDSGSPDRSLKCFEKAISTLNAILQKHRGEKTATGYLRNSYLGRALAHDKLRMFAEAVQDWDKAIALSPLGEQPTLRAGRSKSRVHIGQVDEALADIANVLNHPGVPTPFLYDFGCIYSVASSKIADKKAEYSDQAMAHLRKAIKAGYKDAAHMKKDADLDPLRDRDDFKKLLAELEKSAKPEPKK